ncbi:hypothetical protein PV325_012278 [Microctonus aethiopoides]|uniref:Gamma-glutamyltranspeptidase 1 n=1 Tax=Microctonus aethiopoides TaxID=144406 RepID=A0AA39FMD6_9HYME|nr:hypothetical protein PV325_012278 [Microctonus aethiopoides]KAK0172277.1 hypothetical protein PV328_005615 [Microctonus aethiopoides]
MFGLSRKIVAGAVAGVIAVILIIIIVLFTTQKNTTAESEFISPSKLGVFSKAAVSTHGEECAVIGKDILLKNGSAVDASIAILLCEGLSSLHSMGLGGGFFMTIWDAASGKAEFLNARESAPGKATRDMFGSNASLSMFGGLAVAVPGELAGYWAAHQKYGRLSWRELFLPTIKLCEIGTVVNPYQAETLKTKLPQIRAEPSLAEILIDPKTNSTWTIGDKIKRPKLMETLKIIAEHGIDVFYNGSLGEAIVKEIQNFGGIIEMDDLRNYRVQWKEPITSTFGNNFTMYAPNLPSCGILLTFMMNVLENFIPSTKDNVFWQRIIETFKWAYGRRTELGDNPSPELDDLIANLSSKEYAHEIRNKIKEDWTSNDPAFYGANFHTPDDSGTAHISVLAPDGSAVSATSTINQILGAMIRSQSTGIIFNDEMDDFSSPNITNGFNVPPSPANYIAPGKRPLSSMIPTIIVNDEGKVQLIIGAAGGTKITTAVALATILNLWSGHDIKEALDARRIHHQLFPMTIEAETKFSMPILDYLKTTGHNVTFYAGLGSAVNAISMFNTLNITANADYRRYGAVAGF